ncbi:MAG: hypothetical protein FWD69_07345 [Polyangiaceae bacterium]|nr:hypothetical protein [Polyangiaceae bacterium]
MSLDRETMHKLMEYADGELANDDCRDVEALLATDADAARFVRDIRLLGQVISVVHEHHDGAKIAAFDVATSVMNKLDARRKQAARLRVGGIVAALAVAASVFLLARSKEITVAPSTFALKNDTISKPGSPARMAAEAESRPSAEILVIHGTRCDEPSVDPAIGEMPPLQYNCYKALDKKILPLVKGQTSTMALPDARTFQITLNDVTADKRYKVGAAVSKPDSRDFLKLVNITAEPNKRFNVGDWAYQNGAVVLAIRILP